MPTKETCAEGFGQLYKDRVIRDWAFDPDKDRPSEREYAVTIWLEEDDDQA